ncbi:hypothetical protein DFH06DRAFT_1337352 [Mycena polygramma]|nr:hypothetical protein DFH06DRAFT_1337352 [Mycena polygramma]
MPFLDDFAAHSDSRVLAHGVYKQQFNAIRERSRTKGGPMIALPHLFSFKDMVIPLLPPQAGHVEPLYRKRGLPVYLARVFGRLHSVTTEFNEEDGLPSLIFHLECPESDNEAVTRLYRAQEDLLKQIVELDQDLIPGPVCRGFCSPGTIDIWGPGDEHASYALSDWGSRALPGANMQLTVRLERFEGEPDDNGQIVKEYRAWMEIHHGFGT